MLNRIFFNCKHPKGDKKQGLYDTKFELFVPLLAIEVYYFILL